MELRRIETMHRIPSDIDAITNLTNSFMQDLIRQGYDADTTFAIRLGFAEALTNAFKHGNKQNPDKCITVCYRMDRGWAEIEIRDEGGGFDPGQVPDATSDEAIYKTTGRGLLLMRSLFDEVTFKHGGCSVRLTKRVCCAQACSA